MDVSGRGVLVVVNDEIHGAREVTKTVSSRPDAWSSGNLGVLGLLDKRGNMGFYRRTERDHTADTGPAIVGTDPADFPRVEILYSMVDTDGSLARAAVEGTDGVDGADGLVLAATPTGAPSNPDPEEGQLAVLKDLIDEGIPVALSHRRSEGWPYPRQGTSGAIHCPDRRRGSSWRSPCWKRLTPIGSRGTSTAVERRVGDRPRVGYTASAGPQR